MEDLVASGIIQGELDEDFGDKEEEEFVYSPRTKRPDTVTVTLPTNTQVHL